MPFMSDLHKFCDTHIQEIKLFAYGLGIAGAVLVARDLRLATRFCHVSEIPARFLRSHVTLQGTVRRIGTYGVLYVEHEPVFTLPFTKWVSSLRPKQPEQNLLAVELAGVDVTSMAVDWLNEKVLDKHIWFKLLHTSRDAVFCSVYRKNSLMLKVNVNEEVVKQGLAPVLHKDVILLSKDEVTHAYLMKLVAAETKAREKEVGIWESLPEREGRRSLLRKVFSWLTGKVMERKEKRAALNEDKRAAVSEDSVESEQTVVKKVGEDTEPPAVKKAFSWLGEKAKERWRNKG